MLFEKLLMTAAQDDGLLGIFQGISTLIEQFSNPVEQKLAIARIVLIIVALLLIYLGRKGVLEGLLMIPMGLGMIAVNAGMLLMPGPDADALTHDSNKAQDRLVRVLDSKIDLASIAANAGEEFKVDSAVSAAITRLAAREITLIIADKHQNVADLSPESFATLVNDKTTTNALFGVKGADQCRIEDLRGILNATSLQIAQGAKKNADIFDGDALTLVGAAENPMKTEKQNLFVKATLDTDSVSGTVALMSWLQIDCMQPIYTFTFSNGLIACFVFMGIGALLDVGYLLARPFQSMFIALMAEAGTILTLPLALIIGGSTYTVMDAASIAMVGSADGPMVLFTALQLSPQLFAPITVVAYLYLGLCYGVYPYLCKWLIPAKLRSIVPPKEIEIDLSSGEKLAFAVLANFLLCLLFPVAAPLFLSLFLGIAVKEAGLKAFHDLLSGGVLYFSTLLLGLLLGLLCEASVMLDPKVMWILILGMLALLISALGGIVGGYILWIVTGGKFNPTIGIAGVSCVPTCAKVAQKSVTKANPAAIVMPHALGASISGVITSAIICGIYVNLFKSLANLLK